LPGHRTPLPAAPFHPDTVLRPLPPQPGGHRLRWFWRIPHRPGGSGRQGVWLGRGAVSRRGGFTPRYGEVNSPLQLQTAPRPRIVRNRSRACPGPSEPTDCGPRREPWGHGSC